jgi:acetyl esterase/lipase
VGHDTVVAFAEAMQKAGNRCELHSYDDQGHGFFNFGRGGGKMFVATVTDADRFLESLGYVAGEPTVAQQAKKLGEE